MAKAIQQIMAELDRSAGYASDRSILQNRLKALPGQAQAEIKGLDAKLGQANDNILQGARSRGVGFSGIPIAEQAQYAATDYAPAVARVRTAQNEQSSGILSSLNALSRDQRTQAQSIFENNRNYELQKRQMEEAARAARAAAAYSPGAGDFFDRGDGDPQTPQGVQYDMNQRKGGGFNFTIGGKAVSAATYAKARGMQFRDLLGQMAKKGDPGARAALQFVGNDFGYDRRKIDAAKAKLYNDLVWGSGRNASASSTGLSMGRASSPNLVNARSTPLLRVRG